MNVMTSIFIAKDPETGFSFFIGTDGAYVFDIHDSHANTRIYVEPPCFSLLPTIAKTLAEAVLEPDAIQLMTDHALAYFARAIQTEQLRRVRETGAE